MLLLLLSETFNHYTAFSSEILTVRALPSVSPSASISAAPNGPIYVKFYTGNCHENVSRKSRLVTIRPKYLTLYMKTEESCTVAGDIKTPWKLSVTVKRYQTVRAAEMALTLREHATMLRYTYNVYLVSSPFSSTSYNDFMDKMDIQCRSTFRCLTPRSKAALPAVSPLDHCLTARWWCYISAWLWIGSGGIGSHYILQLFILNIFAVYGRNQVPLHTKTFILNIFAVCKIYSGWKINFGLYTVRLTIGLLVNRCSGS